jgi:hypothetical protein
MVFKVVRFPHPWEARPSGHHARRDLGPPALEPLRGARAPPLPGRNGDETTGATSPPSAAGLRRPRVLPDRPTKAPTSQYRGGQAENRSAAEFSLPGTRGM